ncbi:F-box protein [Phanerochaete sordida]|uniref:F-box protein n=1 Tax=Phanerochaete sordida TaxID=48140 RepID=A0A9P3G7H0_9APHY|nr:F-box protein [Phanerochaete sordida]
MMLSEGKESVIAFGDAVRQALVYGWIDRWKVTRDRNLLKLIAQGSRSHIARLPSELLAEIFHWCILHDHAEHVRSPMDPAPRSWLTVRCVCRAWNQVVLAYPVFSTHIPLTRPRRVSDMLDRSGILPLYIYCAPSSYLDKEDKAEMLALVLDHFPRVAHLSLQFPFYNELVDSRWWQAPHADQAASCLQSFYLRDFYLRAFSMPNSNGPPVLNQGVQLFSGYAFPALRDLKCRGIHTPLSVLGNVLVPGLRCLHLTDIRSTPLEEELLPLLKRLPELEELRFNLALSLSEHSRDTIQYLLATSEPSRRVELPRLAMLYIADNKEDASLAGFLLLHRLSIPPSASIELFLLRTGGISDALWDACTDVVLEKMRPVRYHALSISTNFAGRNVDVELWEEPLRIEDLPPVPELFDSSPCQTRSSGRAGHFRLELSSPCRAFTARLIPQLPTSYVRTARLTDRTVGFQHGIPWDATLSALPSVEDLVLQYETFKHIQSRANPRPYQITPADTRSLHIPALRTLRLYELHHQYSQISEFALDIVTLGCIAHGLAKQAREHRSEDVLVIRGAQPYRRGDV